MKFRNLQPLSRVLFCPIALIFSLTSKSYSGTYTINYSGLSLSTTNCNVFSLPVAISGYSHISVCGGIKYGSNHLILTTGFDATTGNAGGTVYGINFNFKAGYTYQVSINAAASNTSSPVLRAAVFSNLPSFTDQSSTCVVESKATNVATGNYYKGFNLTTTNTSYSLSSFSPSTNLAYLLIGADGASSSAYINSITIVETVPPPPSFQLSPTLVPIACNTAVTQTFAISNPSNIAGVTGYVWNLGGANNGWKYNGSAAPATITTGANVNSITLTSVAGTTAPNNISVTVQINNAASSYIYNSTVSFGCCYSSPPPQPTGVSSTNTTATTANISWLPVTCCGNTGYGIDISIKATGQLVTTGGTDIRSPNITSTTITGLVPNTTYNCAINSVNCAFYFHGTPQISFTTQNCTLPAPVGLNVNGTQSSTQTVITWATVTGATSYALQYKNMTTGVSNTVAVSSPPYVLNDNISTTYQVSVAAMPFSDCSAYATYSPIVTFTTPVAINCAKPTNFSMTPLGTNQYTVNWAPVAGASKYLINSTLVTTSTTYIAPANASGLTCISVQAQCPVNTFGDFLTSQGTGLCMGSVPNSISSGNKVMTPVESDQSDLSYQTGTLNLYPVPASDNLNISFSTKQNCKTQLLIINSSGETIINRTYYAQTGKNLLTTNVNKLTNGFYIVKLIKEGEAPEMQKLIIQK